MTITLNNKKTKNAVLFEKRIIAFIASLFIIFRIPRVMNWGVIYQISYATRSVGDFSVDYVFTIFDLLIIVLGFFYYLKYRAINVVPLLLVLVSYNVLRLLLGKTNVFDLNSFEIVFSILVVLSCGNIVAFYYKDEGDLLVLFKILTLVMFTTQILFFVMGRAGTGDSNYGSGYGALGINSGSLGFVYSLFGLILLSSKKGIIEKAFFLAIVIVGLFLTGSRANMLLFVVFLILFAFIYGRIQTKLFFALAIVVSVPLSFVLASSPLSSNIKFSSLLELFDGNFVDNVLNTLSVQERIQSWNVAFVIIKDNPLGISSSAVDLTTQMFSYGGTTFPHSYFLSYYLTLGIGFVLVLFSFAKEFFLSIKNKSQVALCWLFIFIALFFYGGISTEYVLLFWLYLFLVYSMTLNKKTGESSSYQRL